MNKRKSNKVVATRYIDKHGQHYAKIKGLFFQIPSFKEIPRHIISMIQSGHKLVVTNMDPKTMKYTGHRQTIEFDAVNTRCIFSMAQVPNLFVNQLSHNQVNIDYTNGGVSQKELDRLSQLIIDHPDFTGGNSMGELFIKLKK